MANGNIEALIEATQAETKAHLAVESMLSALRDDFATSCRDFGEIIDRLERIERRQVENGSRIRNIELYIAADHAGDRREVERLRGKINGLAFGKEQEKKVQQPMSTAQIRRELTERIDEEELRTLCFDLGIEYDSLRGEGKAAKVRELVALMERQGGVGRLRQWLEKQKAPGG